MTRSTLSLAAAAALCLALSACQRGAAPEPVPDAPVPVGAEEMPPAAEAAARGAPAAPGTDAEGGSFNGGISADAITGAADRAQGYRAGDPTDLDALKAAVDRVQQANEPLHQAEADKPGAGGVPAVPTRAPSAPTAPPAPQRLPATQFKLTGDTVVPTAPQLANDVIRGVQRVFATQTGCTAIAGIDTRAVSAQGPFDKNAQGRLVSGTLVERWTVSGCGRTAAYHLVMRVRPDSTVDYAIQAA